MTMPSIPDPTSMQRYRIESVAFAEDLGSILVRYAELGSAAGPILAEHVEREISLRDPDDADMHARVWEIVDQLCDILDEAHAGRRQARR